MVVLRQAEVSVKGPFVSQAGKSRLVLDAGRLLVLLKNGMWEWKGRECGHLIITIIHETVCDLNLQNFPFDILAHG